MEREVLPLDGAPQKSRFVVGVFPDPDGVRMFCFQPHDGGVQVLVPAADLDLIRALFKEQMCFLCGREFPCAK